MSNVTVAVRSDLFYKEKKIKNRWPFCGTNVDTCSIPCSQYMTLYLLESPNSPASRLH